MADIPDILAQAHAVSRQDFVQLDPVTGVPSETVMMVIGGAQFDDWESVWIQWDWGSFESYFRFTCAEREAYPSNAPVLQFAPGEEVDIYLGGIQVIKGVIVTRQIAYDANQHMVQLEGVSASWFAARSSIDHKDGDFDGKTFTEIADIVLAPTGVGYKTLGTLDLTPFKAGASHSPSETIGQFLERLARDRKIIVSNTPKGDLLFIGEHELPTTGELIEGGNIKKMQCVITDQLAYSEYMTRAQMKANDEKNGRAASEQEARVDGSLTHYSVLITNIEHPVWTAQEVATRNDTEKMWNEELTKIDVTVTVYGWFRPIATSIPSIAKGPAAGQTGHTLWMAGDQVSVKSPMALLKGQEILKIRTVTWTQDNQNGSQTILNLTTPQGLNGPPILRNDLSRPTTGPPVTPPPAGAVTGQGTITIRPVLPGS